MKKLCLLLAGAMIVVSCTNDNSDSVWNPVENDKVEIQIIPTSTLNVYTLKALNTDQPYIRWDIGTGNGKTIKGNDATAKYPYKGTYTVTLSYQSEVSWRTLTKTAEITITEDNLELIEYEADEIMTLLSGGEAYPEGRTWVIDSTAVGHVGVGSPDDYDAGYWSAEPLEYTGTNLYKSSMTFVFSTNKLPFTLKNNGTTLAAEKSGDEMTARGATVVDPLPGDQEKWWNYDVSTADWQWFTSTFDDKNYINFPDGGGFLMYYTQGTHRYEILDITENTLFVRQVRSLEPVVATYLKFIREGYEKPSSNAIFDNFEDPLSVLMTAMEGNGANLDKNFNNPFQEGINTSAKVAKYEKTGPWGCLQAAQEINMNDYNMVSMKVYFPSGNDYAGGLKKTAAIKLRDMTQPSPWESEANKTVDVFELDKWVEVVFDLTDQIKTDRNMFQIQLGGEGEGTPNGTFYFDDFKFFTIDTYESDDFEGGALGQIMGGIEPYGATFDKNFDNPDPNAEGANPSAKVAKYSKATDYYGAVEFALADGVFDLSVYNKVSMKLYFPSGNDYTTENAGEEWQTDKRLQPEIKVRFRDTGANPHERQLERSFKIISADYYDKWVDVTFDFSGETKNDCSVFQIQFGGEAHTGTGDFYFDDFKFYGDK